MLYMDDWHEILQDMSPMSNFQAGQPALSMPLHQPWLRKAGNCPGTQFDTYEGSEYFNHGPRQEISRSTSLSKIIWGPIEAQKGPQVDRNGLQKKRTFAYKIK